MADNQQPGAGTIKKRVWIRASPELVYEVLTDTRELTHWFCDRASGQVREGGELLAYWKTGPFIREGRALVTRFVPGSALELLWIGDGYGAETGKASHRLSYTIRQRAGATEVIMLDDDEVVTDHESVALLDRGWNSVLMELKNYCEYRERSARLRARERIDNNHSGE